MVTPVRCPLRVCWYWTLSAEIFNWKFASHAGRLLYLTLNVLHFTSVLTPTTRQTVLLQNQHFRAFSPWYTISEECLTHIFFPFFFTAVHFTSSKHSAPVHQMQYYIPTPQSPNRTLSCQIDSLVNSTSWIWYCLATAEKLLLAASFGMRSGLERSCGKGRRRLGEKKWGYINYNGSVWFRLPSGSPPGTRQN